MLDLGLETKGTAAFKFLLLIQVPLPFTDANETKLATNYWNVRMLAVRVLAFPPNATSGCFGTQNNNKIFVFRCVFFEPNCFVWAGLGFQATTSTLPSSTTGPR
jgi:hypothetical protein